MKITITDIGKSKNIQVECFYCYPVHSVIAKSANTDHKLVRSWLDTVWSEVIGILVDFHGLNLTDFFSTALFIESSKMNRS
jgi:hypothetical protein